MAVDVIGRRYQTAYGDEIDQNFRVTGAYTAVYTVRVDDECADEPFILASPDIPQLNDQSDIFTGLRVYSRSAIEVGYRVWEVTVNYRTRQPILSGGSGSGGGLGPGGPGGEDYQPQDPDPEVSPLEQKPWERGSQARVGTRSKKFLMSFAPFFGTSAAPSVNPTTLPWHTGGSLREDVNGVPYVPVSNSAGESIYYDTTRPVYTVTLSKSILEFDFAAWTKNVGTVNQNAVTLMGQVWEPYTVLIEDFTSSENFYTDPETSEVTQYFDVSYSYLIDPYTHIEEFADVGTIYFTNGRTSTSVIGDASVFRNAENELITGPLDGTGDKGNGNEVIYMRYCPFPIANW